MNPHVRILDPKSSEKGETLLLFYCKKPCRRSRKLLPGKCLTKEHNFLTVLCDYFNGIITFLPPESPAQHCRAEVENFDIYLTSSRGVLLLSILAKSNGTSIPYKYHKLCACPPISLSLPPFSCPKICFHYVVLNHISLWATALTTTSLGQFQGIHRDIQRETNKNPEVARRLPSCGSPN